MVSLLFFKIKNRNQIDLHTRTYLSFRLSKIISLQSYPVISFIFSNFFKSFCKLRHQRRSLRGRRRMNMRRKRWTFFWSFYFSYSSFNFCNLSLDCLCKFSTKLSFALILETKNESNLLIKNENKEAFWSLSSFEKYSPCFTK